MAETLLILHLLFVLYMIFGFIYGLWSNRKLFRLIHVSLLAGVTLLILADLPCPLTVLEESFSSRDYGESFLLYWLNRIVYLEWMEPDTVFWGDLAFAGLVFSSFWWRPLPAAAKDN